VSAVTPPLRVLLVDDEPPALARLRRLLGEMPGIVVAGEAGDGIEALDAVKRLRPDALLIDVQMPEVSGDEVAASMAADGPAVIFVTAFERYALQAFDAAAVDYLLKPVDPERLARALGRLRDRRGPQQPPSPRHLLVEERGCVHAIAIDSIAWLAAADNYVELHAADGGYWLLRRTLSALLSELGPAFQRIHRSRAVALSAVAEVLPTNKGDALVRLSGGTELPCSRGHRAALVEALRQRR
jgi:two-component system LytT family response regulator